MNDMSEPFETTPPPPPREPSDATTSAAPSSPFPPAAGDGIKQSRVYAMLAMLMLVYALNIIDRQLVNILADPISRELGLSDTQIGLMTGLAFALFYTTLGIPLARYSDNRRTDRVSLISVCLAFWSIMTALCGAAQNFAQIFLTRIGVGAGEAGCLPAATSLISDMVPRYKRARAMAVFGMGLPLGTLCGLAIGGMLVDQLGWRWAFLILGLPGVLFALILRWAMRDPRRQGSAKLNEATTAIPIMEVIREILASRSFMWMLAGSCASAFLTYGKGVWQVIFLIRVHDLSATQIGLWLGITGGVLGILGTWIGGWAADRFGGRKASSYLLLPIIGSAFSFPLYLLGYTAEAWWVAIALISIPQLLNAFGFGPTFTIINGVVRPQSRGMAVAIKLFVQTIIGLGFGPLMFGVASDLLQPHFGDESVRIVLLVTAGLCLIAAICDWRASRHLERELQYLG